MLKNNNTMVITGKGFGQTNLIAIDAAGSLIEEQADRGSAVERPGGPAERELPNVVRLQSRLHADGSARRRRQGVHGSRDPDLDPQRLRRGLDGREIARAEGPAPVAFRATRRGRKPNQAWQLSTHYRPIATDRMSPFDVERAAEGSNRGLPSGQTSVHVWPPRSCRTNGRAHSSGIPALRRPSSRWSQYSTYRGSVCAATNCALADFHSASVLAAPKVAR